MCPAEKEPCVRDKFHSGCLDEQTRRQPARGAWTRAKRPPRFTKQLQFCKNAYFLVILMQKRLLLELFPKKQLSGEQSGPVIVHHGHHLPRHDCLFSPEKCVILR